MFGRATIRLGIRPHSSLHRFRLSSVTVVCWLGGRKGKRLPGKPVTLISNGSVPEQVKEHNGDRLSQTHLENRR